jgi:hypothetical protein
VGIKDPDATPWEKEGRRREEKREGERGGREDERRERMGP